VSESGQERRISAVRNISALPPRADERVHGQMHVHLDHNLHAAFVHVLADAAVSVLVIIGLVAGRQFGWLWMDPVMGMVATVVILSWAWTLIRSAGAVLLDVCPDAALSRKIAARLEQGSDRVFDLHLWRLGPGHLAAIVSLVTHETRAPDYYKRRLVDLPGLSHITIEVVPCPGARH
jgi:cation diffusion facilitator family transporter